MNSIKLQIYLYRRYFYLIKLIIINDSYSETQPINLLNEFRMIKIKDNDFMVLTKIDFLFSDYDFIADIKCILFIFIILDVEKNELRQHYFNNLLYTLVYLGIFFSFISSIIWYLVVFKIYIEESSGLQRNLLILPSIQIMYFISLYIFLDSKTSN
jgi:hypothetical protein